MGGERAAGGGERLRGWGAGGDKEWGVGGGRAGWCWAKYLRRFGPDSSAVLEVHLRVLSAQLTPGGFSPNSPAVRGLSPASPNQLAGGNLPLASSN
jgi:hypothetical protein